MAQENIGERFEGYQIYEQHYEKVGKVGDLFVDENDVPEYIGLKTGLFGGPQRGVWCACGPCGGKVLAG